MISKDAVTIAMNLNNSFRKYVEELFFNKNVKTALIIGHARGVAVLAGARKGIDLFEYTPLQVKQAVVGYGRADKQQVQQMIKLILNLREIPKPDDAADALGGQFVHQAQKIIDRQGDLHHCDPIHGLHFFGDAAPADYHFRLRVFLHHRLGLLVTGGIYFKRYSHFGGHNSGQLGHIDKGGQK